MSPVYRENRTSPSLENEKRFSFMGVLASSRELPVRHISETRVDFWEEKFAANVARDRKTGRELKKMGHSARLLCLG